MEAAHSTETGTDLFVDDIETGTDLGLASRADIVDK
jgi:hypothetical protein